MIWSPQILYNIVNNNRYMYPFFYFFFTNLEKVTYLLFLIKNEGNNITNINKYTIIISFIYLLLSIVILFLQSFLGPRFMLSMKYHKKEFSINIPYRLLKDKSKSQLYKKICIICLSKTSDIAKKEEKNKASNENKNDNVAKSLDNSMETNIENNNITTSRIDLVTSANQSDNNNLSNARQSLRVIRNSIKLFINALRNLGVNLKNILLESLFSFYLIKRKLKNKVIMLVPCGHIFHSICLSEWLKNKSKCPICSGELPEFK